MTHHHNIDASLLVSDHFPIEMQLTGGVADRGKGYWKMNTSHLVNEDYQNRIDVLAEDLVEPAGGSIIDRWEFFKSKVKQISMAFEKTTARKLRDRREKRRTDIRNLFSLSNWLRWNSGDNPAIKRLHRGLELIDQSSFREELLAIGTVPNNSNTLLKIPQLYQFTMEKLNLLWKEEDDYVRKSVYLKDQYNREALDFAVHPSKEFFLQTKVDKGRERLIRALKREDGSEVSSCEGMLETASHFYQDLWHTRETDDEYQKRLLDSLETSLSDVDRKRLDFPVCEEEVLIAIKSMATGKTPGLDGIPAEFYKSFDSVLAEHITILCNTVLQSSCTPSQRLAVTSLLFKKGDRADMKNYRPISLLNVDYKIIAKVLANRIKSVLLSLVHHDQTGFVPGADIGENVLLAQSIIDFCEEQNRIGYLILLDWEKAFDRVDHTFMLKVLKRFGFGDFFVKAVQALYAEAESCISVNQFISPAFAVHSGVRQGCPLSPSLFILVVECLSARIRSNSGIEGIIEPLSKAHTVVSSFADVCRVFLSNIESFVPVQDEIFFYEKATGAKLNKDKTLVLRVGPIRRLPVSAVEREFCPFRFVVDGDPPVKLLGMLVGPNITEGAIFKDPLHKLNTYIAFLSRLRLSLRAKAVLFNTRVMSIFLYRARLCFCPTIHIALKNAALLLLWGKKVKRAKIRWEKLICSPQLGGVGIIDPESKLLSVKATWLLRGFKKEGNSAWRNWFWYRLFLHCTRDLRCIPEPLALERFYAKMYSQDFIGQVLWCWHVLTGGAKPHTLFADEWIKRVRIFKTLKTQRSMEDCFAIFYLTACHVPMSSLSFKGTWQVLSARSVYQACITKYMVQTPSQFSGFNIELSNNVLVCDSVSANVRDFWFRLRHNAVVTLTQLSHFAVDVLNDFCPVCRLARETRDHAFSTCLSLRSLWRELEVKLHDSGFPNVMMDDDLWNLRIPNSLSIAKHCIRLIALLHFYHWKERSRVSRSISRYDVQSVLMKWMAYL
ncbi:MAG: RNA-directed DNA polymerase [Candidatus Bathyarchaeia archaeon]